MCEPVASCIGFSVKCTLWSVRIIPKGRDLYWYTNTLEAANQGSLMSATPLLSRRGLMIGCIQITLRAGKDVVDKENQWYIKKVD